MITGEKINNFLGGILNPITGAFNNVVGTTTTSTTTSADATQKSNSKTGLIIVATLGVITLVVIGVLIFKNKN